MSAKSARYAIPHDRFKPEGFSALRLAGYALVPTLVAMVFFWFLR